jgi:hypothetical protein
MVGRRREWTVNHPNYLDVSVAHPTDTTARRPTRSVPNPHKGRWDRQTLCERMSTQGPYTWTTHCENSGPGSIALGGRGKNLHLSTLPRERTRTESCRFRYPNYGEESGKKRSKRIHPDTLPPSPNRVGWCIIFSSLDTRWVRCSSWNLMRISLASEEVGSELRRNWETSTLPTIKLRRGTGFRIHNCERREIEEFRLFLHCEEREGWLRSKGL